MRNAYDIEYVRHPRINWISPFSGSMFLKIMMGMMGMNEIRYILAIFLGSSLISNFVLAMYKLYSDEMNDDMRMAEINPCVLKSHVSSGANTKKMAEFIIVILKFTFVSPNPL